MNQSALRFVSGSEPVTQHKTPDLPPRGFIAEWTVTIVLLLFGTTTLAQAFVVPTGSMENTILVGDHLMVDRLAYAPAGDVSNTCFRTRMCAAATSLFCGIRWTSGRIM